MGITFLKGSKHVQEGIRLAGGGWLRVGNGADSPPALIQGSKHRWRGAMRSRATKMQDLIDGHKVNLSLNAILY